MIIVKLKSFSFYNVIFSLEIGVPRNSAPSTALFAYTDKPAPFIRVCH